MNKTSGIHHISAIVGNPQENVDFYAGVLGLRLVKKTVNFDDPGTYHLYFGNDAGAPGTIITFFPWPDGRRGTIGSGQTGVTSYAIPSGSLNFWEKRLEKFHIPYNKTSRFGGIYLEFDDPHGLHLELTEREEGRQSNWNHGGVPAGMAVKGFAGAVLLSSEPDETRKVLTDVLGLEQLGEEGDLIRFLSREGHTIDVKQTVLPRGRMGTGIVHHIAWRAADGQEHAAWRETIAGHGYAVTPIKNRKYFDAVYFREAGGILFELATDPPGFAIDEQADSLGERLMLPPWLEETRDRLEAELMPVIPRVLEEDENE